MASRPLVSVQSVSKDAAAAGQVVLPGVFVAPIRPDLVQFVHSNMNKNHRQAYGVKPEAGHQCAAESWGTGRAVSRIPRVHGGGTNRSGQGAFGNMCRGGRMFSPNKVWRKWHHSINVTQRRYAVASALAASAIPALVMARGHRIETVPEVPLVIADDVQTVEKTQKALDILKAIGALTDVEKVKASVAIRRGAGKARNRRYVQRRGPLVIYGEDNGIVKAFRNIPGVDTCNVSRLNLLQLAPGGHLGRFCIWTKSAFEKLDSLYGTPAKVSASKTDYHMPRPTMTQADLHRIINSDEVQSALKAKKSPAKIQRKKNPLRNLGVMNKLNPFHRVQLRRQLAGAKAAKKPATKEAKSKITKVSNATRKRLFA
jgi:large subunit ribosomal protein L4e